MAVLQGLLDESVYPVSVWPALSSLELPVLLRQTERAAFPLERLVQEALEQRTALQAPPVSQLLASRRLVAREPPALGLGQPRALPVQPA